MLDSEQSVPISTKVVKINPECLSFGFQVRGWWLRVRWSYLLENKGDVFSLIVFPSIFNSAI
jgi:hypothetical protein